MTHTIKASEVKPGMTIRWEQEDLVFQFPVARAIQFGDRRLLRTPMRKVVMIPPDTEVTVLSEPAPPQPEEPTELGVKARVRKGRFVRLHEGLAGSNVWFEEGTGYRWTWDDLCEMGPVTVIPDQGWPVAADAPEVPERAEEWDTWEDVPKGVAVTTPGLFCHYRKNQGVVEVSYPKENPDWMKCGIRYMSHRYAPWTRVTNA